MALAGSADDIIQHANERNLHDDQRWHALMHYLPGMFGGYKSVVDDPRFFMSEKGKFDPGAELEATIRAFFDPMPESDDEHPACRFVARYEWLDRELGIAAAGAQARECEKFRDYMKRTDPRSASLIFPEAYINSPASMFGHTLLRLDTPLETKLISHGVNYAALTNETFGPAFAFKGIFGLYKGYFSVKPYYELLKSYSLIENRNIWEYQLSLSEDEVRWMALHVWEMRDIYSYYYFFDENCSYILLFLLEVARPDMDLPESFTFGVMPVDTIRAVKERGIVVSAEYRPARASRIRHISSLARPENRRLARHVAEGAADPAKVASDESMPREERIRVLDLSSEYVQFMASKHKLPVDEYKIRFLDILGQRATLGRQEYDIPSPTQPELGHLPAMFAIGAGTFEGDNYISLTYRPSYHDILDPDEGYTPGAAITFFQTNARYWERDNSLRLEKLSLVDITSLSPAGTFFRPITWVVDVGFEREYIDPLGDDRTPLKISTAGGMAFSSGPTDYEDLVYALFGPSIKAGGGVADGYAFGGGIMAGALVKPQPRWKVRLDLSAREYAWGDVHREKTLRLGQNVKLSQNMSATLTCERRKFHGEYLDRAELILNLYL